MYPQVELNAIRVYMFIVCVILTHYLSVTQASEEKDLFHTIFKGYEPKLRPVKNASHTTYVTLGLNLIQLKEIDERSETHSIVGIFDVEWNDEYLTWNPADFANITEIVVPPYQVWLPDFAILNSASEFYQDVFFKHFRVNVNHTGRVVWPIGGVFVTQCDIDTTFYPMDTQNCTIIIENWVYTKKAVDLVAERDKVHTDQFEEDGIWDLINTTIYEGDTMYVTHSGIHYPKLKISFKWRRKPHYYVVNVMLPCFFLLCIALLVFWLPPDSGEKVSLGMSVLLAFSVFQLIIADNTPENSESTPILSMFVSLAMAMSTSSVITTVFVLHLHFKPDCTAAPKWLKFLCFNIFARMMCIDKRLKHRVIRDTKPPDCKSFTCQVSVENIHNVPKKNHGHDSSNNLSVEEQPFVGEMAVNNDLKEVASRLHKIVKEIEKLSSKMNDDNDATNASEWQDIAIVIDRLFFWIALVVVIGSFCGIYFNRD